MKRKKQQIFVAIALLLIACVIQGVFVSCDTNQTSPGSNADQSPGTHEEWEPPPTFDPIELPDLGPAPDPGIKDNVETPDRPITAGSYAASRESDRYHRPSCHYVDNILPENLIYFSSEQAARQAGYYPCAVCKP